MRETGEQSMKANVGGVDKILRIVVGLGLLSLILILQGDVRWWGLIGLVPLLTGLVNFCPLYALLGLNTCPMKDKSA
jgi:Inner membrane protein YgaP-like, transmembrane domain